MPMPATPLMLRTLFLWEGRLSRGRVMKIFDLRQTRASEAIRSFCEAHPGWTRLNTVTRSHEATPQAWHEAFKGMSLHDKATSFTSYLAITNTPLAAHIERDDGIVWSAFPELSVPNPQDFAAIHRAIGQGVTLEILYRSIADPEPHRRTIRPHSIVRAGRRWHVRAYCAENEGFRDFTFGRVVDIRTSTLTLKTTASDDTDWNTRVKVEIVAHPGLSEAQQHLVRDEYFGGTAALVTQCRACLVPYYVRDLDAALDPEKEPAPKYLLAVGNAREVARWMFP